MPTFIRKYLHQARQSGAAAVEFALILPLLLAVIFATVEFGFALYDKALITDASREAARAGVVVAPRLATSQIESVAIDYYCSRVVTFATSPCTSGNGGNASVTVTYPTEPFLDTTGAVIRTDNLVSVKVSFSYQGLALGWLMGALGQPMTISATSAMRLE